MAGFDVSLVGRVERLTGRPAHHLLRRLLFFALRDFDAILDAFEKGKKFYVYMSRCSSSESPHLGHLAVFMFAKYLQDAFKIPLVIQLTDTELSIWKGLPLMECTRLAHENAKDIIACGFDIRTFIFSSDGFTFGEFYKNGIRFEQCVKYHKALEFLPSNH